MTRRQEGHRIVSSALHNPVKRMRKLDECCIAIVIVTCSGVSACPKLLTGGRIFYTENTLVAYF